MGYPKIIFLGGLLGVIFLALMGWVAFSTPLDLGGSIFGGLVTNMGSLTSLIPGGFGAIVSALLGTLMLVVFPIHWALQYRPGDVMLILGIMIPWIVAGTLNSLIFAHDAKQGFVSGLAIMVYPVILGLILILGLSGVLSNMIGFDVGSIINGVFMGLVDLPAIAAILLATFEGGCLAGVFGALIGALKYSPGSAGKAKGTQKGETKGKGKEEGLALDFD